MSAEPINFCVVDLSHHDPGEDYEAARDDGIAGVIFKATQGQGFHDELYHEQRIKARDAGLLWGAYHFGDETAVEGQVANFIEYAEIREDELFCLDYEENPGSGGTMTLDKAKRWITGVEEILDRPMECVLYSGNLIKETLGNRMDRWWGSRRLWLAQYGTNPNWPLAWDKYWLWQYSGDGLGPQPHTCAGMPPDIDCNSFAGSVSELAAQWAHGVALPLPPAEQLLVRIYIDAPPEVRVELHTNELPP
jgi:lysozyme